MAKTKFKPRGIEHCHSCKKSDSLIRVDKYDSVACKRCNIWLEGCCCDSKCEFCSKKPKTPDKADWDNKNNTFYGTQRARPKPI